MDRNNYGIVRQGSGVWRSLRDEDFEEEDVWDVLKNRKDNPGSFNSSDISSMPSRKTLASSRGRISHSNSSWHETKFVQQTVPVNIPSFSNVRKKTDKAPLYHVPLEEMEQEVDEDNDDTRGGSVEVADEVEHEGYVVPPHELIARRMAKSHISSFSVLEGVGRTLKGRDLKKVRNAVLIRTGFLESL